MTKKIGFCPDGLNTITAPLTYACSLHIYDAHRPISSTVSSEPANKRYPVLIGSHVAATSGVIRDTTFKCNLDIVYTTLHSECMKYHHQKHR